MGYAAPVAMVAMTAASTAMSASSAMKQGAAEQSGMNARGNALLFQVPQVEQQMDETRLETQDQEQGRQLMLQKMTAANSADAAARGITQDSASLEALNRSNAVNVGTDLGRIAYMGDRQIDALRMRIKGLSEGATDFYSAGSEAMGRGVSNAWGAVARGVMGLMMSMGGMTVGGGGGAAAGGAGGTAYGSYAPVAGSMTYGGPR